LQATKRQRDAHRTGGLRSSSPRSLNECVRCIPGLHEFLSFWSVEKGGNVLEEDKRSVQVANAFSRF
jgi:hypothetical protein